MKHYMITAPRLTKEDPWGIQHPTSKREIRLILDMFDVKSYTIGIEKGKGGYEHFQIRLSVSGDDFFERTHALEPSWHIEEAETQATDYERKEGRFWASNDTSEVRLQRFGKLTIGQEIVMGVLEKNSDRQITVWITEEGGFGKSWLAGHLWEIGKAYICQSQDNVKGMIQDIASDYIKHGWRPYIVIDLPRTWKWTTDLYCAIERLKDGLIKETRYNSETINIRGVKILVLCNEAPVLDRLSQDRWILIETNPQPKTKETKTKKKAALKEEAPLS